MAPLINQLVGNNRNLGYLFDGESDENTHPTKPFLRFLTQIRRI